MCPSADKELKRLAQVPRNYKNEDNPFEKLKGNLPALIIGRDVRYGKGQNPAIEHLEKMRAVLDKNQSDYEKIKSKYNRSIEFLQKYDKP